MSEAEFDWTPFLMLALLLALVAAQHWLLCAAVLLAWERLLQFWRRRLFGPDNATRSVGLWSRE